MIAAVYARKSTEQSGVSEIAKSVTRQIEHAKAYAVRKGWTVADDQIYIDDGISGAEFTRRPGFIRLMAALKPLAPFQVLVMSEESRLGREVIETAYALKQLITAGVRVFFYLEDRERLLESPTDKIMLSLTTFADEMEREKARARTYDAMARKARAGHVTGGRVFGYDNRRSSEGVHRVINPAEAAVVRRIFEMYARGLGFTAIARALNDEGVPAPRAQQGRPTGWCKSSIRPVLHRELYRGRIVWNKTRARNQWGIKDRRSKSRAEWITIEAPALRIVPAPLWEAAHRALGDRHAAYLTSTDGQAGGRPPRGTLAKYLLSGLGRCGQCGGSIKVRSRAHGSTAGLTRHYQYGCAANWDRGSRVCTNTEAIALPRVDDAIREWLIAEVFSPAVLETAIGIAVATARNAGATTGARQAALDKAIAACDRELENLAAAVATASGNIPALAKALTERQDRRDRLAAERAALSVANPARTQATLEAQFRTRMADCRSLLKKHPEKTRQILESILEDRIVFTPVRTRLGGTGYQIRISIDISSVFEGVLPLAGASPRQPARPWHLRRTFLFGAA